MDASHTHCRTQSLSGASPDTLLALRFPAYDQTLSNSDVANFSVFESAPSFGAFLFTSCILAGLQGLPVTGVEEQNVGVANGEAYGVC